MRSAKIFYTVKLDSFLLMLAKWYFLSLTLLVLTACGSSSNSDNNNPQPTLQTLAIEKIADYAQNGGTEPSLQDYTDAGVTGVTASNLVTINTTVAGLSEADVDTQAEIQTLADNLVIVIPNIAPTATADTIEAVENITITFDVLGNDTDVDGTLDKTSVTINTPVSNGSTSINPTTGEISYTPAADYSGADSFAYTVQDDDGLASNEVTVSITVDVDTDNDGTGNKQDLDDDGDGFSDLDEIAAATDPLDANSTPAVTPPTPIPPTPPTPIVNNAPKANADSVNAVENQPITFDILNNDTDTDGSLNKTSVRINTAVSNGTTSINPSTGEITYTPTADYSGTDSLAYTVQDNKGLVSNEATVSILVDVDTDGNGIGNTQDLDDDGDGFSDVDEIAAGTDPLNPNSKPTLTAKQIAIEKIANYAQNGTTAPTLQDYLDAGITGIDSNNLVAMNTAVEALSSDEADTESEIQAVASSLMAPLAAPSIVNASAQSYTIGNIITALIFTNNGGGELSSCSTTPLPVGLSIAVSTDNSTCEITGTPTAEQSATIYTITATNSAGNDTATVNIEVKTSDSTDVTSPLITVKTPDSDERDVKLEATVEVTFNEDMFAQTITENSFLLKDSNGDIIPSIVSFDASTNKAVLTPNENLSLHTTYTSNLKPTIFDLSGNALADTSWQFITRDGEWQNPTVRVSNGAARTPSLAKGDESKAVVVWPQQTGSIDEIWAAQHSKEDGWADPERIQTTIAVDAVSTKVAMNKKGDAIAVWTQGGEVWARHLSDQTWGLSQVISNSNINANSILNLNIAINEVGDAVIVWKQATPLVNGTHMFGVNYSVENGWGTAREVGDATLTGDVFNPEVAMNSQGNAIVAWSYTINTPNFKTTTWTNRFIKGSGWGNEEIIIDVGSATPIPLRFNAFTPKIFIDSSNTVWMAWTEQRTVTATNIISRVLVGRFQSDGVFASIVIPGVLGRVMGSPEIVVDHQGKAIAVWVEQDGQNNIVKSSQYVGSVWSTPESIQTDNTRYSNTVKLGVDKTGNAMAVWIEGDRSSSSPDIWANRYTLDGGWGIAEIIENEDGRVLTPQLVVDSKGTAIAVWRQNGRFGGAYILKSNSFK